MERASANDLMQLASDAGPAPLHIGALLLLEGDDDRPAVARDALVERTATVRRLRQRLVRAPIGCGRPIWVDDAGFDPAQHVDVVTCPAPGDEAALFDLASALMTAPLPDDRPRWRARIVTGLADGRIALVVVVHHVLADGVGGLAMLGALVDGVAACNPPADFPEPAPSWTALAADAARQRARAAARLLRHGPAWWAVVRAPRRSRPRRRRAPRTSVNRPTGPTRDLAVVRTGLDDLLAGAHALGGTVNDVVLVAVAATLAGVLAERGEPVGHLVVSVPVSGRVGGAEGAAPGNQVGVMPVVVPTRGHRADRVREVAAATAAAKATSRTASASLIEPVFRLLGALRLVRPITEHQRLVNTFVTNLRGPTDRLAFAGMPIDELVAVSPTEGNVSVAFAVLSYAGVVRITVIADPGAGVAASVLADRLSAELAAISAAAPVTPIAGSGA